MPAAGDCTINPVRLPLSLAYHNLRRLALVAKKRAIADKLYDAHEDKVAQQLQECSETETLVACHECRHRWWVIVKCGHRLCPICSRVEAARRGDILAAHTHELQHPKLVTLTADPNGQTPRGQVKRLRTAWAKLRRTPMFKKCKGGAYTLELKPEAWGWHVHLHAVLDIQYIPQKKLFAAWRNIISERCPQVDIRAAETAEARRYVAKYVCKNDTLLLEPNRAAEYLEATRGIRLFSTFGCWHRLKLKDQPRPSPEDKPKCQCPNCHATGTVFRVRQGAIVFGMDAWRDIESVFLEEGNHTRPLTTNP